MIEMTGGTNYFPVFFDIETTGLNPLAQGWHNYTDYDAQVTAVGLGWFEDYPDSTEEREIEVVYDGSEYRLLFNLRGKMERIEKENGDEDTEFILVGFNSRQYDHPYLTARYGRLRQDPYPFAYSWKRVDMMKALRSRDGKYWNQDDYADHIGVHTEDEYDGSDMPEAFAKNQWRKILDHVRADMEDLMDIFRHEPDVYMNHFYDHYGIESDSVTTDDTEL